MKLLLAVSNKNSYIQQIAKLQGILLSAIMRGFVECMSQIIDVIKEHDFNHKEAILFASGSSNYEVFTCVVNAINDLFIKVANSPFGLLCLNKACKTDCFGIAQYLLTAGVQPNVVDNLYKYQPLMLVKSIDMAKLLIEHGADVNGISMNPKVCSSGDPVSVLYVAGLNARYDLVEYFIEQGAVVDVDLVCLVFKNFTIGEKMQQILVRYLKNPNQLDSTQCCPLQLAVKGQDFLSVKTLVENGADVNIDIKSPVIFSAVMTDNVEILRFLLDHGADVNVIDDIHLTPLICAVRAFGTDSAAVKCLIEKGADVDHIANCEGFNVLWYAYRYADSLDKFNCVLEKVTDLNIIYPDDNMTLLSIALDQFTNSFKTPSSLLSKYPVLLLALLKAGAKASLNLTKITYSSLHTCLNFNAFGYFAALIHYGGFCPVLLDQRSDFCKVRRSVLNLLRGVFSPFCMALVCGHVTIAKEMLDASFLTMTDLNIIPTHYGLQEVIKAECSDEKIVEVNAFLMEMSCTAPSLKQLCLVYVSDIIGPHPEREQKIAQLGLPIPLQQCLMFSQKDIIAPSYLDDLDDINKCDFEDALHHNCSNIIEFWSDSEETSDENDGEDGQKD